MKIYFDIDGVLRNLSSHILGHDPEQWHWELNGHNIFSFIYHNPIFLIEAPASSFVPIIANLDTINILSHQNEEWIPYTTYWLSLHFDMEKTVINYVNSAAEKLFYLNDAILFDDYPKFENYKNIYVVDHKYNKHIKDCEGRISTVEQMKEAIKERGAYAENPKV